MTEISIEELTETLSLLATAISQGNHILTMQLGDQITRAKKSNAAPCSGALQVGVDHFLRMCQHSVEFALTDYKVFWTRSNEAKRTLALESTNNMHAQAEELQQHIHAWRQRNVA
jgi:hypothetical protein